jgi:hypothetical protein
MGENLTQGVEGMHGRGWVLCEESKMFKELVDVPVE